MKVFKHILLLIELRLTEFSYNLLMFDAYNNIKKLVECRIRIEELRDKIKEL